MYHQDKNQGHKPQLDEAASDTPESRETSMANLPSSPTLSPWQSKVIALTGSIGCGKSTVLELLRERGACVISADDLAREVVAPGSEGIKEIVSRFGAEVLTSDGQLDRKKLGRLVFTDKTAREALENITHPRIRALAQQRFEEAEARGEKFLVYEVPLLFETGLDKIGFKSIAVVSCPKEVAIERIQRRDNLTREEAMARINAQMSSEEKASRADIVIPNGGTIEELANNMAAALPSMRK